MNLQNTESALQLHESLEVIYVVDGFVATFFTADGDVKVCEAHGETIAEALQKLDAKLAGWNRADLFAKRNSK